MTDIAFLKELNKSLDCMQQQYPNQNLEIRMTKKTFEKMRILDIPTNIEEMSSGVLGVYGGTTVVIVPDTYFPDGVSPDAVLVCPECSESIVNFESGEML